MQQGNLILIKLMIKGECVLTTLRVLNWQRAHYGTNFCKRNVFHIIIKCTYLKKTIPLSATSCQYTGSSCNMAVDDSHGTLNYVLVGANNCTCKCERFFVLLFIEHFLKIKQMLDNVWKMCPYNPSTVLILFQFSKEVITS